MNLMIEHHIIFNYHRLRNSFRLNLYWSLLRQCNNAKKEKQKQNIVVTPKMLLNKTIQHDKLFVFSLPFSYLI